MDTARVLLLFPPPSDPAQPYSSLPTLAAYLRAFDVDVRVADLNIEAVQHLLSADVLDASRRATSAWLADAESRHALGALDADRYLRSVHARAVGADIVDAARTAASGLRDPSTYRSMRALCDVRDAVDDAYRLVSAAAYPMVATRHKLDTGGDPWNAAFLNELVTGDPDRLLLGAWLRRRVTTLIDAHRPTLVGISLTYPDQVPLAFAALAAVRDVDPRIHTCLGGATATRLAGRLESLGELASLVDTVVVGEGEEALLALARRIGARSSTAGIPNTINITSAGNVAGPRAPALSMDALPVPAYDMLPLSQYLAPEPVLLVGGSRACYWGRCEFCDVSGSARETYRERALELVVEDFHTLHDRTGARCFMFADLAISPIRLASLGDRLRETRLDARWLCQARLETGFTADRIDRMAAGGCRLLVFGLESASEPVLKRMVKGTRMRDTAPILQACATAGIAVNLQTFIGFPGETEDEARDTVRFVIGQQHTVTSVALTSFKLIEGTAAFEHAPSLGLSDLRQADGTLDVLWDFDVASGLSPARAEELAATLQQDIAASFPAVDRGLSWNAYALLLVADNGPDVLRERDDRPVTSLAHLRLPASVVLVHLAFHAGELADLVRGATGGSLRDRQRRLRACAETAAHRPTWTLIDTRAGRLIPLDDETASLVARCDGSRGLDDLLAPSRSVVAAGRLLKLVQQGLLESGAARPEIPVPISTHHAELTR